MKKLTDEDWIEMLGEAHEEIEKLRRALMEIEVMAGSAGAGEMPAMPLATIARNALEQ